MYAVHSLHPFKSILFFNIFIDVALFCCLNLSHPMLKNLLILIIAYFYYVFILPLCHLLKLPRTAEVMSDIGYNDVGLLYHPLVSPRDCEAFGYGFEAFGVDGVC